MSGHSHPFILTKQHWLDFSTDTESKKSVAVFQTICD